MKEINEKEVNDRIEYLDNYISRYLLRKDTIRNSVNYKTFITKLIDKLYVNKMDEDSDLDSCIIGTMYLFVVCNTDEELYNRSVIESYRWLFDDLVMSGVEKDEAKTIICNQFASAYATQKDIPSLIVRGVSHIFSGITMKYFAPTFD